MTNATATNATCDYCGGKVTAGASDAMQDGNRRWQHSTCFDNDHPDYDDDRCPCDNADC